MADPLAISTGIITFTGAVLKITQEIMGAINRIKNARQDIISLGREIEDLYGILQSLTKLHQTIKKSDARKIKECGLAPETLKLFRDDLASLKKVMISLERQFNGGKLQRFKARYYFTQGRRASIAAFITRIQTCKSSLTLALSVFQTAQGETIQRQVIASNATLSNLAITSSSTNNDVERIQQSLGYTNYGIDNLQRSSIHTKDGIERVELSLATANNGVQSLHTSISRTHSDMSQIKQSLITIDQRTKETQVQPFPIAPDGTCHILPYPKNDRFVGRSDVLAQLQSFLLPPDLKGQGGTSFALYGMPGVGKTQTALQFVYSNKDKFPVIFWISASSKDKIILGYDEIARALGLNKTVTSADQEESIRLVKTWLSHTDTWWLLVFDNLDNLDDVTAFWPTSKNGAVLVTSQDPSSVHTLAKQGCRLDLFSPEEGINLITNISQATNVSISQDEAEQVARVLGYHPLAINQMATFIIKSGCSIPSFLELYAQREASNELQGIDCKCPWYKNTVAAAFDLTIERAEKLGSEASALLDVLSLFDPDKIPEQMLSKESLGAVSDVHRLVAISDLRSMTLLSDNPENNTVSVHRLVRDAALRKIKSSQVKANTAFNTAIFLLRKVFPLHGLARDHMTESWMQCEMYLSHVLALHDRYQEVQDTRFVQVSIDFVELLYSCAWYLCERGRFEISSKLICTAENTYKSLTCLETNLFWADLCTVKLFYVNETDHSSTAIELATEAHEIRETAVENGVLEEDHPNRANGLMNLGVMYTKVQPLKAIELHTSAIAIRQQSTRYRDDQVHGLALNYLNLGRSYWCAGQLDDAADSLEKCLATIKEREEACGYRFVLSGWALWALGNVQIDRGRLEEALVLHTESMDLHEKILGPLHLKTAASYHKMAWLLWKQEEYTRAIDILKLALSVYDKRPEDMTAERARSKWLLSQLLKDSAPENEEWRQELDAARDLRKRIQGETQLSEDSQESYDLLVTYFYR